MSRFHQHLREDLKDPEFAEAFYDMSVDIALLLFLLKLACLRHKTLSGENTCSTHTTTQLSPLHDH